MVKRTTAMGCGKCAYSSVSSCIKFSFSLRSIDESSRPKTVRLAAPGGGWGAQAELDTECPRWAPKSVGVKKIKG